MRGNSRLDSRPVDIFPLISSLCDIKKMLDLPSLSVTNTVVTRTISEDKSPDEGHKTAKQT